MIAGISKRFLAPLDEKVSEQMRMSLNRVSLVVIIGSIKKLEAKVVPDGFEKSGVDLKYVHVSLDFA